MNIFLKIKNIIYCFKHFSIIKQKIFVFKTKKLNKFFTYFFVILYEDF